ncbi:hypothetical protein CE91St56_17480 [Lachnospiraceae bacterium]|nr:hypothetical protein CE91St56_17480 [Lachnospiraceae bacterium]
MGGTYRQESDYLIPNLVLPDTGDFSLSCFNLCATVFLLMPIFSESFGIV